jgi:tetratricopeptide (TPR) repeat protein
VQFFITGRYRLAMVAVLLVGAGVAVEHLWRAARGREARTFAVTLLCVVVLALAINVDTIEFGFASMYNAVGAYLGRSGDMDGAAEEFRKAVEDNPDDLSSRYNLGLALNELGQYEQAAGQFEAAVERHPRYFEAWIGLGRAFAGLGANERALESWRQVAVATPRAPDALIAEARGLAAALAETENDTETESNR